MPTQAGKAFIPFSGEFSELEKGAKAATAQMAGHLQESFKGLVGPAMLTAVAAAVGAVVVESVKMAAGFQEATTQLVTGAGESVKNLDLIRKGLLDMASQVGSTPAELAKGLYNIESAGFHGAAALDVLRASAEGAKVGQADQAVVADALTSALNAYGLGAGQATNVTNDLIATVASGKMHMADLAASIGGILAPAAAVHVNLAEVSAAVATMTMQGTGAAQATTYMRQTLISLSAELPKGQKALKNIGLDYNAVAAGIQKQPDGFIATLRTINEHLDTKFPKSAAIAKAEFAKVAAGTQTADQALANLANNGGQGYIAALKDIAGGSRQMMGLLELTGGHLSTLQSNFDSINASVKGGNGAITGWALVSDDFNQKMSRIKGGFDALLISIGTPLLPVLGDIATTVANELTVAVSAVSAFSQSQQAIDIFSTAWGLLQRSIHTAISVVRTDVMPVLGDLWKFVSTNVWPTFLHFVTDVGPPLLKAFSDIAAFIRAPVIPAIESLWDWFKTNLLPVIKDVVTFVAGTLVPKLLEIGSTIVSNVLPQLLGFGSFVTEHLIKPGFEFAKAVIPPILDALKFLADHIWIVEAALGALALRWLVIKALGIYTEVLKMATAFALMAGQEGVGAAIKAVMGLGGEGGALAKLIPGLAGAKVATAEMGAASTAAGISTAALATGGIALVAAAALALIFNVGGARDKLHDFLFAVGDAEDSLKRLGDGLKGNSDLFDQWNGNAAVDIDKLKQQFMDAQGFTDKLNGNTLVAAGNMSNTIAMGGQKAAAVIAQLANSGSWDAINQFEKNIANSGGDVTIALQAMAKQGGPNGDTARALILGFQAQQRAADDAYNEMQRVSHNAFLALQRDSYLAKAQTAADAVTAAADIENAYGQGSKQAADYIRANLTPAQQDQIAIIDKIAAQLGLTREQVIGFGRDGVLAYGGVKGSLADVIAHQDDLTAAVDRSTIAANYLKDGFKTVAQQASYAAQQAAGIAVAAAGAATKGAGGHFAAGGKVTREQFALVGEGGEAEWIIPAHKARGFEGLLDSLLSGSALRVPSLGIGADPAIASLRQLSVAGAGAGAAAPSTATRNVNIQMNAQTNADPYTIARAIGNELWRAG